MGESAARPERAIDVFLADVDRSLTAARLLADALTVPLLALATMRNAQWRTDIRMSHNAAFHALTLVSSGVFLLSAVLERFFGLYSAINSFSRLTVKTRKGVLKRWSPRAGEQILL